MPVFVGISPGEMTKSKTDHQMSEPTRFRFIDISNAKKRKLFGPAADETKKMDSK